MTTKRKRQQGLTLLEVMVALAIFAVTGSAILKAVGENLNVVGQIESITMANWVANNQLVRVKLEQPWPIPNNRRGSVEMAQRTWYWAQTVSKTNDDDLKQVTIRVGLDPTYNDTVTSVTAYFVRPTDNG
jgi:general secretion pathway protein I